MKEFYQLRKNSKNDFSVLKTIKVGVLGDTATQFLIDALRSVGFEKDINLHIWEAEFNQIERQIFDSASELYQHNLEIVVIFQSSHKLLGKYNKLHVDQQASLASAELEGIEVKYNTIVKNLHARVIFYNYTEIDDAVFGNYANITESSFLFQLRKLNYELMHFAAKNPDFYLCDISTIQNRVGKTTFFHPSIYINSEMVLSSACTETTIFEGALLFQSFLHFGKVCFVLFEPKDIFLF